MKHNREYEIAWLGLKDGVHTFQYELDDEFMQEHGEPGDAIRNVDARVNLSFDKKSGFFMLHFDVGGKVTVPCDRCGDDFELPLWDEFDLLIKLSGADESELPEEEDDVVFIPRSETVIDISNWLYEFVMLSIPLQRIHPNGPDGQPGCNPQAISLLNQLSEHTEAPRNDLWKGLEALKDISPEAPETNKKRKSK
jgi:uncharacterized metal-binding protein YceD (DUF177 family)